ncbi:MAG: zf-HC2 domain-containing protein [Chloroflexi bacterium]|nr:zf-HC2 domain-containing protein [Chloroflexota bacterium]
MWLLRSAHRHIAQDTLSEYLDGRLQGRTLERVERQLEECDACRQDLAELQATVAMMQQLPMVEPRRSFVMSAPPPEPARAETIRGRPNLALRAPNWVYAGAASVAALALAVTISVDATGGLKSDPLRQEAVTTAAAPVAESQQITGTSGPISGPGPAGQSGIQSAARSAETTDDTSGPGEEEGAPPSLAAAAPAAATSDQSAQEEPAVGGTSSFGAEAAAVPPATSAPRVGPAPATQDEQTTVAESAAAPVAVPAPEDGVETQTESKIDDTETSAAATGDSGPEVRESIGPVSGPGPAATDLYTDIKGGGTSTWWRLLEAAAGILAVASLTVLVVRWRAGRRDSV